MKGIIIQITLCINILFFVMGVASGQVRLPRIFSEGMVLQRELQIPVWGWAGSQEKIVVKFDQGTYETTADNKGEWSVSLPAHAAGGPFTLEVSGSNTITVKNILVGDVWICAGQSNMEMSMMGVKDVYPRDIAQAENPDIRYFGVPLRCEFKEPQTDFLFGKWQSADPKSVLNFSAVGYFFARELFARYHVPIGLIGTAVGGTPIESWISEKSIEAYPSYYQDAQLFKDKDLIKNIEKQNKGYSQAWYAELGQKDEAYKEPGKKWKDPEYDASGWETISVPGYWTGTPLEPVDGVVWFRREFDIPSDMAAQPAILYLGRIVDGDSAFVNGTFVGTVGFQYPQRVYTIPAGLLKEGRNTLIVKVINTSGRGGFVPDKPYEIKEGEKTIDLKGIWKYRVGAVMGPMPNTTTIIYKPVGLYNGMIAPLQKFPIKGALWYQGESNAERPKEYAQLFPTMIRDWREKWNEGDFPFLYVQLPNFMESKLQPSESNWALFRESQLKTLLVHNTGMAVTIDVGEWNDIHPVRKLEVGQRLALAAEKVAYGDTKVVYSGPIYESMTIKGKKVVLTFTNTGSGLSSKGSNELKCFAIAGGDRKFGWAKAQIRKNRVVVWNDKISHPVAVRYAWADNPEGANLFNREGLPASPFRTDNW